MLETPFLRRDTRNFAAWKYANAQAANSRLEQAVGFKDLFHFYQIRRGAGEATDGRATTAVRNRVIGHDRTQTFDTHYTKPRIG